MTVAPNFATPWGAYNIWETPNSWDDVKAAWYQTHIRLTHKDVHSQLKLRFEAVNFHARIYLNGHYVGENVGGTLPFTLDISRVAHVGDNILWVGVEGPEAVAEPTGFLYPMGSWWGQRCAGIWQDVWLVKQDPLELGEVAINTSVRRREFSLTSTMTNQSRHPVDAHLTYQVWDGSRVLFRRDERHHLTPGAQQPLQWTVTWHGPHLWSPESPHLYHATLDVRVGGTVRDSQSVRFGFREVWIEGDQIILNGQPIRLRGDEWHYFGSLENSRAYAETWYRMAKTAHVNYIRLHAMPYPPVFYDVADEVGMLIVGESAIYGSSRNLALANPEFWVHAKSHLAARVLRDRHHPSIILWSAENEVLAGNGPTWAPHVAQLKGPMRAVDDTRPIYFEGDGDPEGVANLISWHYPLEVGSAPALPGEAYAYEPGGARAQDWSHQKPLMVSEFGAMWYGTPRLLSVLGGSRVYDSLENFWEANALATQAQLEGFRAAGITGVAPWNLVWYGLEPWPLKVLALPHPSLHTSGSKPRRVGSLAMTLNPGWSRNEPSYRPNPIHQAIQRSYQPQTVFDRDWSEHAFAGEPYQRTLTVHNDTTVSTTLRLHWQWSGDRHTVIGEKTLTMAPLGIETVTAQLHLPHAQSKQTGTWAVRLETREGAPLTVAKRPLSLYPSSPSAAPASVLTIYDPVGKTRQALQRIGYRTVPWDGSANAPGPLVVGEGTLLDATLWNAVSALVQQGISTLVLAQNPGWSGGPGLHVDKQAVTRTFVRSPHDAAVAGLASPDVSWWRGRGNTVAHGLLTKPETTNAFIITDGGQALGGVALLRWPFPPGAVWFCQYPLIQRFDQEPLATHILSRVIQALTIPVHQRPIVLWGTRLEIALKAVGASPSSSEAVPSDSATVLLIDFGDAKAAALAEANTRKLKAWVRAGGRLWIHQPSDRSVRWIHAISGWGGRLVPVPDRLRHGTLNPHRSRLTDGLSNVDLDWTASLNGPELLRSAWRNIPKSAVLLETTSLDWHDYGGRPEQIKTASTIKSGGWPGAAAAWQRPLGQGVIVVEQLQWDAKDAPNRAILARLAQAIRS